MNGSVCVPLASLNDSNTMNNCTYTAVEKVTDTVFDNICYSTKIFFSFSVWVHLLSKAIAQKVLFGIFLEHFYLPHLNHYICF